MSRPTLSLVEQGKLLQLELGEALQENVTLAPYTSLRVGGVADFFIECRSSELLLRAVAAAIFARLPYLVLGGGTNVVISDSGFPGLVIINRNRELAISPSEGVVVAGSGLSIGELVSQVAGRSLSGLEPFAGLPGTVGGATYGNAESFGRSFGSIVREVTLVRERRPRFMRSTALEMVELFTLPRAKLNLGYRTSSLKEASDRDTPIILSVKLQLQHRSQEAILSTMKEYMQKRLALNQARAERSSGSFFKNPGGSSHRRDGVVIGHDQSAGWLLDQSGCRGLSVGGASVSRSHANFLVNRDQASAEDIRRLADRCREKVAAKFRTVLEEEVEYLGRW